MISATTAEPMAETVSTNIIQIRSASDVLDSIGRHPDVWQRLLKMMEKANRLLPDDLDEDAGISIYNGNQFQISAGNYHVNISIDGVIEPWVDFVDDDKHYKLNSDNPLSLLVGLLKAEANAKVRGKELTFEDRCRIEDRTVIYF